MPVGLPGEPWAAFDSWVHEKLHKPSSSAKDHQLLPLSNFVFFRFGFVAISHSVVSDSLQPHGLQPTRLLCPWDSPDKILEWVSIPFSIEPS